MNEAGNKSSREQSSQWQGGLAPLSLLGFWECSKEPGLYSQRRVHIRAQSQTIYSPFVPT